ncbi:MAG: PDZ domain-containing protein [Firmicutes bacterium]|nr:PDZ domain-containing protein [Bacillota bacterium]
MRKKIAIIITVFTSLFVGALGMYFVMQYSSSDVIRTVFRDTKNVTITSNDSISESVDKLYDSVVVVQTSFNNQKVGSGTGFVYKLDKEKGYIITNNHVVSDGNTYNVIFSNGKSVDATLLGSDVYSDIAVLSVDEENVTGVATIGKSSSMKVGDTVFTIGAPISDEYSGTVTKGIISGKDRMVSVTLNNQIGDYLMNVMQTDAAINPGNSGGPLANINGEVIGINSLKLVQQEIEGIGFAIPIDEAMVFVERLEKGEKIVRPMLGVTLLNMNESYELYLSGIVINNDSPTGVVIGSISNDSPAQSANLQKGDIITKINGQSVDSRAKLRYELYKHTVGDKIDVTYYRNGKEHKVTLTLDKALQQ